MVGRMDCPDVQGVHTDARALVACGVRDIPGVSSPGPNNSISNMSSSFASGIGQVPGKPRRNFVQSLNASGAANAGAVTSLTRSYLETY
jgi:hypothetical protein